MTAHYDFYDVGQVERDLREQKGLLVNLSRGLDALAGKRTGTKVPKPERSPGDLLVKVACSELLRSTRVQGGSVVYDESAADVARRLFGSDIEVIGVVERAAVSPADTATSGYAGLLVPTSTAQFLASSDTPSAFSQLSARCLSVEPSGSVKVPSRVHPLVLSGSWIGEAAPKAVYQVTLTSVTLAPYKLAALSTWSEEIATMSVPSIEAVVRDALLHDLNGLLDQTLLDATASSSVRPAGLFASASSVTASTATPLTEAMYADLGALSAAVATNAPDSRPIFIANSKQGWRLKAAGFGDDVIISNYMTAGSVGAIDANAVVMMVGGVEFRSSISATIHSSDAPTALSVAGSPNTIASPVTSLFQQDLIGLRSKLLASWAKRRTGCTALATTVAW